MTEIPILYSLMAYLRWFPLFPVFSKFVRMHFPLTELKQKTSAGVMSGGLIESR